MSTIVNIAVPCHRFNDTRKCIEHFENSFPKSYIDENGHLVVRIGPPLEVIANPGDGTFVFRGKDSRVLPTLTEAEIPYSLVS